MQVFVNKGNSSKILLDFSRRLKRTTNISLATLLLISPLPGNKNE